MNIVISSGHGKIVRGAEGILDEVNEARRVVDRTVELLKAGGIGAVKFHDNTSTSQSENLDTIVRFHNSQQRDLDVSVHFNCYDGTASGCEVLYVSQAELAGKVATAICNASGLKNRGPKKRTDLKFLNSTDEPAILIETCFVDSQADADIYRAKFEDICQAISRSLTGQAVAPPTNPEPPEPLPPNPEPPTPTPTVTFTVHPPGSVKIIQG